MVNIQFYLLWILQKVTQAHFYVFCSLLVVDILSRKWLDVYLVCFSFWRSHHITVTQLFTPTTPPSPYKDHKKKQEVFKSEYSLRNSKYIK